MTPARGAGDLACPTIARLKGRAAPAATILSPVARDYPSCALGGFFRPPRLNCSIKERDEVVTRFVKRKGFVIYNLFTAQIGE
jgi:hypothetical protein